MIGLAALGAIGLIALAYRRGEAPVAAPDLETRAPEVTAPQAPNVQVPEVEVTAKPPAASEVATPTPEPAAPEVAAPAPQAAAPELAEPEPRAAAPAAEIERDTSGPQVLGPERRCGSALGLLGGK